MRRVFKTTDGRKVDAKLLHVAGKVALGHYLLGGETYQVTVRNPVIGVPSERCKQLYVYVKLERILDDEERTIFREWVKAEDWYHLLDHYHGVKESCRLTIL